MRELTTYEKKIVEGLIKLKNDSNLLELQTARILRKKSSNFLAIKWCSENKYSLSIYYNADDENTQINELRAKEALEKYFEICDFLYFIRELEENKMVVIQTISSDNLKIKTLYDKNCFKYNEEDDKFYPVNSDGISKELLPLINQHWSFLNTYTDIVLLLDKFLYCKIIYPLPLLEDYVANGYKTIEQKNFAKQIYKTNCSLKIAFAALIISAIIPFLENICTSPAKIDEVQLKAIEQAIINSKTAWPNAINIQSPDTLKIKNISPTQK